MRETIVRVNEGLRAQLSKDLGAFAGLLFEIGAGRMLIENNARQFARPAFRRDLDGISFAFLPFDDLCEHCEALCKFGEDHSILKKIARAV